MCGIIAVLHSPGSSCYYPTAMSSKVPASAIQEALKLERQNVIDLGYDDKKILGDNPPWDINH